MKAMEEALKVALSEDWDQVKALLRNMSPAELRMFYDRLGRLHMEVSHMIIRRSGS